MSVSSISMASLLFCGATRPRCASLRSFHIQKPGPRGCQRQPDLLIRVRAQLLSSRNLQATPLPGSLSLRRPLRWPPMTSKMPFHFSLTAIQRPASHTPAMAITAKRRTLLAWVPSTYRLHLRPGQCSCCSFGATASMAKSNFRGRCSSVATMRARRAPMAPLRAGQSGLRTHLTKLPQAL